MILDQCVCTVKMSKEFWGENSNIVDFLEPFQNIFGMKIQIFTNLKKKNLELKIEFLN